MCCWRPKSVIGWNRDDPRFAAKRLYFVDTISSPSLLATINAGKLPVISIRNDKESPTAWADVAAGKKDAKIAQWHEALAAVAPNIVWIAYWAEQTGYVKGVGGRGPCGTALEYKAAAEHVYAELADLPHLRWANCLMGFDTSGLLKGDPKYNGIDPDIPFDMYAIDTYGGSTSIYNPIVEYAKRKGVPSSIWETGAYLTGQAHADWILRVGDYVEANGMNGLLFFNGGALDNPPIPDYILIQGPEDEAALDELTSRPYFA